MYRFILVYLSVYGGANFYLFWKLHRVLRGRLWPQIVAGAFLTLLVFAPILIRGLDLQQRFPAVRTLTWPGYLWVAVVFWFFMLGVVVEGWNLSAWALGHRWPVIGRYEITSKMQLIASSILIVVGIIWGVFEAWNVRLLTYHIEVPQFAADAKPIRVAVITDVHLSHSVGRRRLARIIARVEEAQPDIIVSLGDLNDLRGENADHLAAMLRDMHAPMGKFAVMGNHEFYAGLENSEAFHEQAGFEMLRQEAVILDNRLRIVGVDDPSGWHRSDNVHSDENAVLPKQKDELFTILLKHRPRIRPQSINRFDLQLSGHSHGGQIFPFQLFVLLEKFVPPGLNRYANGTMVYVSRGSGTWGPPLRVLAPPEVDLFILENSSGTTNRGE